MSKRSHRSHRKSYMTEGLQNWYTSVKYALVPRKSQFTRRRIVQDAHCHAIYAFRPTSAASHQPSLLLFAFSSLTRSLYAQARTAAICAGWRDWRGHARTDRRRSRVRRNAATSRRHRSARRLHASRSARGQLTPSPSRRVAASRCGTTRRITSGEADEARHRNAARADPALQRHRLGDTHAERTRAGSRRR